MKNLFSMLMLVTLGLKAAGQNSDKLYLITENNLYGYIDKTGKTLIEPRFPAAGQFSEGLAPVRLKGTYGYINKTGSFSIPAQYDMAFPFSQGLAKVFIDSTPFFITTKGEIAFQHHYKNISDFGKNSFATVLTHTGKWGLIDRKGNLLADTVFVKIGSFSEGLAVVTGLQHNPYSHNSTEKIRYEKGVIDTLGNWRVNYGEYAHIHDFKNGYARVELADEAQRDNSTDQGIIDKTGRYRFTLPEHKWDFDYNHPDFYEDKAVVRIYENHAAKYRFSGKREEYRGMVNAGGNILFSNPDWVELTPFQHNRAFAKDEKGNWFLIDTQGEIVTDQVFQEILYHTYRGEAEFLFQDAMAFVKIEEGWGVIDTTGNLLIESRKLASHHSDLIRRGAVLFMRKDISVESDNYAYQYGFWNTATQVFVQPQFHDIDMEGFGDDLIYVMKDGKSGYINARGEQIWEAKNEVKKVRLNIDYMNRGYYYVPLSKKLSPEFNFSPHTLQMHIDTNRRVIWEEKYEAVSLFVANTSVDTVYFDVQDFRLYLKLQAQDKQGNWRDIEYLPNSWCGNSYSTLSLASGEFWRFEMPLYQGEFKTKLRAQLLYKKSITQEKDEVIYSNETEGYINPGQFWNKPEYHSSGLMDPYDD